MRAQPLAADVEGEQAAAMRIQSMHRGRQARREVDAMRALLLGPNTEEDEDEDDDVGDLPDLPPPATVKRVRGFSVSAEVYGEFNKKAAFKAPVYEKTPDQLTRIKKCLGESFLFNALEEEELNTVILAVREKTVKAKERLIEEGDDGDCMFIIESGLVDCLKKSDGAETVVKTCTAGDVFGELALLYNCPRAASVEVMEDAFLWELDRQTFNNIVKESAAKTQGTAETRAAATRIQSMHRGRQARREVEGMRTRPLAAAMNEEPIVSDANQQKTDAEREMAATRVQSLHRGRAARKEVQEMRSGVVPQFSNTEKEAVEEAERKAALAAGIDAFLQACIMHNKNKEIQRVAEHAADRVLQGVYMRQLRKANIKDPSVGPPVGTCFFPSLVARGVK
jgi:CRP-like cAMP-binding protein